MRTGATGKFYVTDHAIARYVERFRPGLHRRAALAELIAISSAAERVRACSDGTEVWRGPKDAPVSRMIFLVAPRSEGLLPAISTVPARKMLAPSPNNHAARRKAKRKAEFLEAMQASLVSGVRPGDVTHATLRIIGRAWPAVTADRCTRAKRLRGDRLPSSGKLPGSRSRSWTR